MAYPSIISQPGSAARNIEPVLGALTPLIDITPTPQHILELASYPYEHIRHYAVRWPDVEFSGTARDKDEIAGIETNDLPSNVAAPQQLDVAVQQDWDALKGNVKAPVDGVIMLNLVHCTPEGVPEHVFRNLSPKTDEGRRLLRKGGWVAAYGAYLNDDGSYRSEGDEKFDHSYIKAMDPSLGLRTPVSISQMAEKWGFREEVREDMPKGNLWIVWRAVE